ncbi:potassium-transporting ATPase subunit KdpA [Gloeobacter violaceus]|uniref:Potassium-transporting ATPase potassium-binding subunit n=1 Tax=Gloeobacter violaceus (strain ATCC 29082 / PCC 7421) TaxID=251221 RepID=KDPA_GLOVI|nr:potassium-transporting ATPase subunit KdpA [Gloeobacter violaceus]Q7NN41.1 RecName: Full=Potassium-transporting ATPase potassium-binding subunit; AltName: Full=ATP phosphohydrolase [potassium-transporting] A chain; AltName: Full=Potassium-binding and translocating subunit A; AltName: Full=Potassium-translocating ATPase A chain [Gloeobacter violaceus PCC 7421]BAC88514.1 potassium-transporting P-type ATPase A chain [Gloeobacter violaceus PCC 7421]
MAFEGVLQIVATLVLMVAIVPFFGTYMARVFQGESTWLDRVLGPIENLVYRLGGVRPELTMDWWSYARAVLASNAAMFVPVFAVLLLQGSLPLNPNGISGMSWDLALHTAISFLTNTNQQHYSGETGASHLAQMVCFQFLMFTSAATGLAVGIAFIRGLLGKPLGNFYVDLTRSVSRILMPISIAFAVVLLSQGVPQSLGGTTEAQLVDPYRTEQDGKREQVTAQKLVSGPFASMESIKELGENGGGSYGINSAHPYENPNPFTNLLEILLLLAVPTSLIYTFGVLANNKKQGWVLFGTIFVLFVGLVGVAALGEYWGNPTVNALLGSANPNFEGQEVRFGWAQSALFATATTGTMTGAVNAMHDSLTPLAGLVTLFNLCLQVIWGGQGTGIAYILVFLIIAVFLTGLMVGRTPEIFGRKLEKREVALASIIFLVHPVIILVPTAIALAIPGLAGNSNPGFHGLTQVVYEYASAAANNGSGFEGLGDATPWWNLSTSVVLLLGRYAPIVALLALAGGLQRKQPVPETPGTLRTDTVLFGSVTAGTILILGALTFFPVFALGPIAEWIANLAGKTL